MFVGNYRYWLISELENSLRTAKPLLGIKMPAGLSKKIMHNNQAYN